MKVLFQMATVVMLLLLLASVSNGAVSKKKGFNGFTETIPHSFEQLEDAYTKALRLNKIPSKIQKFHQLIKNGRDAFLASDGEVTPASGGDATLGDSASSTSDLWHGSKSPGGIVDLDNEGTYYLLFNSSSSAEMSPYVWKLPSDDSDTSADSPAYFNVSVGATATYKPTLHKTGWDYLDIQVNHTLLSTNDNFDNVVLGWYYAGFLEAALTADRIWANYLTAVYSFVNDAKNKPALNFIWDQLYFLSLHAATGVQEKTPSEVELPNFNKTLAQIGLQMFGIMEGYNSVADSVNGQNLTIMDAFLLSYQPEIGDVQTYLGSKAKSLREGQPLKQGETLPLGLTADFDGKLNHVPKPPNWQQHCSALIKPTMDDLFMSHDTWSNFNSMLRQYKTYHFPTDASGDKGVTLSMSSYPGMLNSMDDWYITSNGLTIQETTNGLYNNTLYKEFYPYATKTIPEWMRVMIANYIATDGETWTSYFVHLNSGTYNNQWMVVDMKLYTPFTKYSTAEKTHHAPELPLNDTNVPNGVLWVAETLPGYAVAQDVTSVLRKQGYWASYNIPYFPEIFQLSGNALMEQKYGSFFSFTNYSRPLIFARNQSSIYNIDGMKAMMRYNKFQDDPLSLIPNCTSAKGGVCSPKHSAMLTIASRGDLDPAYGVDRMGILASLSHPAFGYVGLQNLGAIDTKIASWKNMRNNKLKGVVISGPTNYNQVTFDYSSPTMPDMITNVPRYFLPEKYDFPWQEYTPVTRRAGFYGIYFEQGANVPNPGFTVVEGPIPFYTKEAVGLGFSSPKFYLGSVLYNRTQMQTGWHTLKIRMLGSNFFFGPGYQRRAAGFAEGFLTYDLIWDFWVTNVNKTATSWVGKAEEAWVKQHMEFLANGTNETWAASSPAFKNAPAGYQTQLSLTWQQLQGLHEGYNKAVAGMVDPKNNNANLSLSLYQIFLISFQPEFGDVVLGVQQTNFQPGLPRAPAVEYPVGETESNAHCSGFIKFTPEDIFICHATWANFNSMLRIFKTYIFEEVEKGSPNYVNTTVPKTAVSMSSYPGMLASSDDWYTTYNGLAVQETTNLIYNNSLYKAFDTHTVSAWLRAMIANYQATSPKDWSQLFSFLNSGSYNNQWMAVAKDKYDASWYAHPSKIPDDFFWVTETLPGIVNAADKSAHLRQYGYWASYNVPYFPEIYNKSENRLMMEKYGSYFSYTKYARPQIFEREQSTVNSLADVQRVMRYNNYTLDPKSLIPNCKNATDGKCHPDRSALLSIASRGDLDPIGTVDGMGILASRTHFDKQGPFVGLQNLGALDAKIASSKRGMNGVVISGPTTSFDLPVFDWATSPFPAKGGHGMPQRYDFDWQEYGDLTLVQPKQHGIVFPQPTAPKGGPKEAKKGKKEHFPMWVVWTAVGLGFAGLVIGLSVCAKKRKQKKQQNAYGVYEEVSAPVHVASGGFAPNAGGVNSGYGAAQV